MDYMLPLVEHRKVAMPKSVEWAIAVKLLRSNTYSRCAIKTLSSGVRQELKRGKSTFALNMHKLKLWCLQSWTKATGMLGNFLNAVYLFQRFFGSAIKIITHI